MAKVPLVKDEHGLHILEKAVYHIRVPLRQIKPGLYAMDIEEDKEFSTSSIFFERNRYSKTSP